MKYWVYQNGQVPGAFEPAELAAMPGFSQTTLVCPADDSTERQWVKAAHFPELVAAIEKYQVAPPPPPRLADELLSESSHKLFRHVTDLMQELENRREEKAMAKTLQRQLGEVKDELLRTRERAQQLELEVGAARGANEREAALAQQLEGIRAQLKERQTEITALNDQLHGQRQELARYRTQAEELLETNKQLTRQRDDLTKELAEKDATLARALGLIKRMESELDELTGRAVPRLDPWDHPPVEEPKVPPQPPEPPTPSMTAAALASAKPAPVIRTKRGKYQPASTPPMGTAQAPAKTAASAPAPDPVHPPPPVQAPQPQAADGNFAPKPIHPIHAPPKGAFTSDDGSVEKPVPIPPEGELAPITPPWMLAVKKLTGFLKKK